MKRKSGSPEEYRNDVPEDLGAILERVRDLIFQVFPDAEEQIRYGMLDYPGIANLAAQKGYVSLYVKPAVLDRFRDEFQAKCGKSCVRFHRLEQLDEKLLTGLLRALR